ncbi:MAG: dCTP deaminase [Candidatus Kerfeldbacteria bacterium]|nr:dCTP deaminase [Candidatus Kerfeldbacteria bacterium]
MILSDRTIKRLLETGDIIIKPFDPSQLQPASYDISLGSDFLVFDNTKTILIDPRNDTTPGMRKVTVDSEHPFILHPNEFALAATQEIIGVGPKHIAILNGKSSLGRLGLVIHATAGFIDPGNELRPTLELFNVATVPILLYPGMKVGQIVFEELSEPCERPYGHPELHSKYYKDMGVKASQIHQNFKEDKA